MMSYIMTEKLAQERRGEKLKCNIQWSKLLCKYMTKDIQFSQLSNFECDAQEETIEM